MMMNLFYKRIHIIVPTILLVIFTFTKHFDSPYDRTIASDVVGYYAYLPAIFIYHDLSFDFTKQISEKYYVDGRAGKYEFINYYREKGVNKYWIGLSILWLPFFLMAHFLSCLLGFDADGYNCIYQYSIGFATCVYMGFGIYFFRKNIEHFTRNNNIAIAAILATIFGSNIFYYALVEPGHSHVYSFTFLSVFISSIIKINKQEKVNYKIYVIAICVATIVVLIRPLNLFLLLFSLLFIIETKHIKRIWNEYFSNKFISILLPAIPVFFLFLQSALWHKQTSFWLLDSYAGERFNLSVPHFLDFIFSYKKGWLTYTPICLFSMYGIVLYYKHNLYKLLFCSAILFGWIYVLSSWWIWTYGTSYGQRLMIDALPLLGIFMAISFEWIYNSFRIVLFVLITTFISLNVFQTWQQKNGILPSYFVTKSIYWRSFFSTQKHAYALYSSEMLLEKVQKKYSLKGNSYIQTSEHNDSETSAYAEHNYSIAIVDTIPRAYLYGVNKIIFESEISCNRKQTEAAIVFDISRRGKNVSYQKFDVKDYVVENKFEEMNFMIDVPNNLLKGDSLTVYLYNPTQSIDKATMKKVCLTYIKLVKDE